MLTNDKYTTQHKHIPHNRKKDVFKDIIEGIFFMTGDANCFLFSIIFLFYKKNSITPKMTS